MEYCDTCQLDTNHGGYDFCPTETKRKLDKTLLQLSEKHSDLMRLMTAVGPYSTVESAVKFAVRTRQEWVAYHDALEKIRDYIETDYPQLSRAKEMAQEALTEKRVEASPKKECCCQPMGHGQLEHCPGCPVHNESPKRED